MCQVHLKHSVSTEDEYYFYCRLPFPHNLFSVKSPTGIGLSLFIQGYQDEKLDFLLEYFLNNYTSTMKCQTGKSGNFGCLLNTYGLQRDELVSPWHLGSATILVAIPENIIFNFKYSQLMESPTNDVINYKPTGKTHGTIQLIDNNGVLLDPNSLDFRKRKIQLMAKINAAFKLQIGPGLPFIP